MISYDFILQLDREVTDDEAQALLEEFEGDVMPGLDTGRPVLDCNIVAPNFSTALGAVMRFVLEMGLGVAGLQYHGAHTDASEAVYA